MIEIWKEIPGYEGLYAISDQGRVKRISLGANGASKPGRVLKPRPMKNGYLRVGLGKNAQVKDQLIHRLVLLAFKNRPDSSDLQVNHINGNKSDNALNNLEWVTQSQNVRHSYDTLGHKARGETNHMTHFTTDDVLQIRDLAQKGMGYAAIARLFNVTDGAIKKIVLRKTWAHI